MIAKTAQNILSHSGRKKGNQFHIIELFAGEGGFIAGFNRVGGWHHLFAVELAEKHCNVLREVFPNLSVVKDNVALIDWNSKIKGQVVDCVIGGPPCQPFSVSNNRRNGWHDSRNGIPSFVKAIKNINPKTFLLENVPWLWWGDQKHHIQDLIDDLIAFGYTYTDAAILDATDYGAPCHRRRLFIYGTKQPHHWPVKSHKNNPVAARKYLVPLLEQREPDGEPLPDWVKPKIKGARGDIIIDCKQGNKIGRQYVSMDEPCFTLVATQGIRHRIRYKGKYYRMRAEEAATLQGMDPRCTIEGIGNAVNAWQAEAWAKTIKEYLMKLQADQELS
ncbi:MAG: DNA (cytosine-5-)-methyltransferase [Chloroflexi bacterium]|nr:DNA (cytosine-5-)-methyltransferase [Chloroflexota bacterium]